MAWRCVGSNEDSAQGDRVVAALYERFKPAGEQSVDVSDCPDLLPPLAVMAARRDGTTHFVNAARLRMKESDRLSTTAALLHALGVSAEETADSLTVRGVPSFSGGTVDGANDHRIVMAAAAAATAASGSGHRYRRGGGAEILSLPSLRITNAGR